MRSRSRTLRRASCALSAPFIPRRSCAASSRSAGLPRITIRLRPTFNYGQPGVCQAIGSNHMRFTGGVDVLRLTTDAPLSYIANETPFALTHPITLILGTDEPLEASVDTISREFLERTRDYWREWVRGLGIPLDWQGAIIRAAITLKLCQFEETGAIIAAHTTSIPEAPGTQRNWDYRFCWLRDAYFVIRALNRLGATQTMEAYINYITTVAVDVERPLQPLFAIMHNQSLEERIATDLAGFRGMGPVRVGNQAAEQVQHDAYGSVILGASHMFIDERLPRMGDEALFRRLEPLGPSGAAHCSSSPTPARGNTAGASASTRIRRRCAGLPATGWAAWRLCWALAIARPTGTGTQQRCAARS